MKKKLKLGQNSFASDSSLRIEKRETRGEFQELERDGISKRVFFLKDRDRFFLNLDGKQIWGEWKTVSAGDLEGESGSGIDAALSAQLPGKVKEILVRAGDSVKKDQPLLKVEAMKMEFSISAPADGNIAEVLVSAGEQVQPGQLYLKLESGGD